MPGTLSKLPLKVRALFKELVVAKPSWKRFGQQQISEVVETKARMRFKAGGIEQMSDVQSNNNINFRDKQSKILIIS